MKPAQFPGFQQFFGFRQGETIFADRTRDIRCPRQLEKVSRLFDSELEPVCQRAQMGFPLARLLNRNLPCVVPLVSSSNSRRYDGAHIDGEQHGGP